MKKIIFLVIAIMISSSLVQAGLLVMDRYTIPLNQKAAKIGKVLVGDSRKVTLIKDESGLFVLDAQNNVCIKKNKELKSGYPFSYEITIEVDGQIKTFELVKDEFLHNKVIAHRGGWKHHGVHQNSLGSLKSAIEIGCEGSEFDVWLTKDKKLALNHDSEIDGMIVELTNLETMRKIPLEAGEVMATLEEYLSLIKTQNKTRLVLEIKSMPTNNRGLELTDSVVNVVHRMNAQAWVDYISFDYEVLKRVRALDATAHISYLGAAVPMDLQKIEGISGIDYHFSQFEKNPRLYDRARMLGLTINIWTVNDEKWMNDLLDMKVDFITTDEPEMLLKIIEERNKLNKNN